MKSQRSLGKLSKLPVPTLHETLERYLLSVKATIHENEFERTKTIIDEFGKKNGLGEKLQNKLEQLAEKKENWVRN